MTIQTLHMSFTDFAYEFDRLVRMYIYFLCLLVVGMLSSMSILQDTIPTCVSEMLEVGPRWLGPRPS